MTDLWRLLRLFRPYSGWLLGGVGLSLCTLLANVALLALSGWFISAMAIAGAAGASMNYFTPAALIRAAAIARTGGRYAERLVTHEATFRLLAALRVWFYQRLEPLAPAVLEGYHSGDLLSRIRADIDTLDHVYLRLLVPGLVALLAIPLFGLFLWLYDARLAAVTAGLLLVAGLAVPWLVQRLGARAGQRKIELAAALRSALVSDLQGMGELLVYAADERHAERLEGLSRLLAREQRTLSGLHGLSQGAVGLCANLAQWAVLVLAIPLVAAHTLAAPDLAMLVLFVLAGFEAVLPLPPALQALGEVLAAARRIFRLADSPPAVPEPAVPRDLPQTFTLRLENVSFRYRADAPDVVRQVSLTLAPGETLALVGASGCGKSTLVSLLLRFREPTGGRILLDNEPLAECAGEALRARLAVLPQQTHLFNTTLRDNLLLANPAASAQELEAVCRLVLLEDFIRAQPEGLDTLVGETGIRLSGGQARRVALARALLKEAPVLVLDEPTEGIDPDAAQRIMAGILARVRARRQALLLITHQRAGLEGLERILAMAGGRIEASGTHAELLTASAAYRQGFAPSG
jgi:ATP-binding cassette subfamily C protein CydC